MDVRVFVLVRAVSVPCGTRSLQPLKAVSSVEASAQHLARCVQQESRFPIDHPCQEVRHGLTAGEEVVRNPRLSSNASLKQFLQAGSLIGLRPYVS